MQRRQFLATATMTAVALAGTRGWADIGKPAFLAAANDKNNATFIVGLTPQGDVVFKHAIPARGHAAAAHPVRAEAVAFARRPGRFGVVVNCADGRVSAQLHTPDTRHFYGHGAFSADGRYLFTTENDFNLSAPAGRIGVWDVAAGYQRIDDIPSGGIGPHEIIRLQSGGFAVANGGLQTHPDFERKVLNLPDMRPNLTYLDQSGAILETVTPPEAMRPNSIRHLAADRGEHVAIAMQWQGDPFAQAPLLAVHKRGEALVYVEHSAQSALRHYAGSVACSESGGDILVSGPKGDYLLVYGCNEVGAVVEKAAIATPGSAGIARGLQGGYEGAAPFFMTGKRGLCVVASGQIVAEYGVDGLVFDNHLVAI